MITLFSIPKTFTGHVGDIQHNAVASWSQLGRGSQVILMGDDDGVAEAAREHGVEHLPDLGRTPEGTPRLDEAFARAQEMARYSTLCYSNADIVLFPELLDAIDRCPRRDCLLVGRRTDLDVSGRRDRQRSWLEDLRDQASRDGRLHSPSGIDYFVFPRGQIRAMPPFAVGRAFWDLWMIYDHRRRGIPVIDLTPSVRVIHQNHDYSHLAGGQRTAWTGPEVQRVRAILGTDFVPFNIADADWRLEDGRLRRNVSPGQLLRRVIKWPALVPGLRRTVRIARRVRDASRRGPDRGSGSRGGP